MSTLFQSIPREKNVQFTVTFPESLLQELNFFSSFKSLNRSAILRLAFKEYMSKEYGKEDKRK